MMNVLRRQYENVVDIEQYAKDSRLTEPSDAKKYNWRKAIEMAEKSGRPLTKSEMRRFLIK